jgi:thiosulfate reductase cytochrome b subunit
MSDRGHATEPQTLVMSRYRHTLPVRTTHWLNLLILTVMLGSGLQIFNAHPALYWGDRSDPGTAWLSIEARRMESGSLRGVTRLAGQEVDTTGVLGVSAGRGGVEARAFPAWATIPGPRWLAMGRRWHFFFAWLLVANGLVYVIFSLFGRHLTRDLLPSFAELKGLGRSLREHLSVRRLRGQSVQGYNPLQKLAYLAVVFGLGPLVLLTGLTMSPWLDSVFPGLLDLFGGRQSARSIHFIAAFAFVAFLLVHLAMVLLVGPVNHVRAMVTGRLQIRRPKQ